METLLAGPDETDPIIVLMGDEGPYLCPTECIDGSDRRLGIRFGTLAAYFLPDQPAGFFPDDHSHVNTFRGIFSAYFGADLPALPGQVLRLARHLTTCTTSSISPTGSRSRVGPTGQRGSRWRQSKDRTRRRRPMTTRQRPTTRREGPLGPASVTIC